MQGDGEGRENADNDCLLVYYRKFDERLHLGEKIMRNGWDEKQFCQFFPFPLPSEVCRKPRMAMEGVGKFSVSLRCLMRDSAR